MGDTESLVVVKVGQNGADAPRVFEVLEQVGLLGDVSETEVEVAEQGAVGFHVPRDRMAAVVLALECSGFAVKAYEVQTSRRTST